MPGTIRSFLLVACGVALGFVLGTWVGERPRELSGEALSVPEREVQETSPAEAHLIGRDRSAPTAFPAASPEAQAQDANAETTDEAADPRIVARLAVTVPVPPGATRVSGTVYALPAGSTGVRDVSLIPHATLDGETAVVPLPCAGRWDVGCVSRLGAAMVENVHVAAGAVTPVRLTLPPQAAITFSFADRDARDWAAGRDLEVLVRPNRLPNARPFPGRDEGHNWQRLAAIGTDGPTVLSPLPTDREYGWMFRYQGFAKEEDLRSISDRRPYPKWKLRLSPERVHPPADVRISLVEQAEVRVAFALRDTAGLEWPKEVAHHVGAQLLRGSRVLDTLRVEVWGAAELRSRRTLSHADAGPASLVWNGACCLPGRIDGLELVAGKRLRVEAPIDLDPAYRPQEKTESPSVGFHVRAEGEPSEETDAVLLVYAADPRRETAALSGDTEVPSSEASGEDEDLIFEVRGEEWKEVRFVAATHGPDRAARAVPVDAHTDEVVLHLEPAGHLAVVPTWWVPGQLGETLLRRVDGRPVPMCMCFEGGGRPDPPSPFFAVPAKAGVLIGPLVPGRYTFDVLQGTTRVGRVTGTVVAGRIEVLRLPR